MLNYKTKIKFLICIMNIEQFVFFRETIFTELFFLPLSYLMLGNRRWTTLHDPRGGGESAMTALGHLGEIQKSVVFSS